MKIWICIIYEYNECEYNSELMHNINNRLKGKKLLVHTNSSNFRSIIDSHKCLTFSFVVINFIRQKWQQYHGVYTAIGITIVWLCLWLQVSRRNSSVGASVFNHLRRIFPVFLSNILWRFFPVCIIRDKIFISSIQFLQQLLPLNLLFMCRTCCFCLLFSTSFLLLDYGR